VNDARNFVHKNQKYSARDRDEFENGRPLTMPGIKVYPWSTRDREQSRSRYVTHGF